MSLPKLKQQLQQLISLPSISSSSPEWDQSNRPVIDLLAGWLESLGFAIQIQTLASNANKANLIATLGSGPGGLVLAGHTDTVPFDKGSWQSDPFTLRETQNRFYGLGCCDMKGFFVTAIEAARQFKAGDFKQPLILLATADEESSMDGARELAQADTTLGRYAIIGEPTSLRPIRMHKGIMMESIQIQGKSGHSSNPELGFNALDAMQRVLTELLRYREELQRKFNNAAFTVNVPTLNLGSIHGGDNPNRICSHCNLQFDLRILPGMQNETVRQEISTRLSAISHELGCDIQYRPMISGVQPFEQAAGSDIVVAAEQLTGHVAEAVAFATEAPFMQQLGMETIVMGPGSIDQAHQPNEFLELRQIDPCVTLLTEFIKKFCLQTQAQ
ncbi:MAG: acetylornithine deacetylase [Pseudomonadales bacterium]